MGYIKIRKNGSLVKTKHNTLTDLYGVTHTDYLIGDAPDIPNYIAIGTGVLSSDEIANSQTKLKEEVWRSLITSASEHRDDIARLVAAFLSGEGAGDITEVGLFVGAVDEQQIAFCDAVAEGGTWEAETSTNLDPIAADTSNFKEGTGSISVERDGTNSSVLSFNFFLNDDLSGVIEAALDGGNDETTDNLEFWYYNDFPSDGAGIATMSTQSVISGSDSTNFYEWSIGGAYDGTSSDGLDFYDTAGWAKFSRPLDDYDFNLITNPTFESDVTTGWTENITATGSITRDATPVASTTFGNSVDSHLIGIAAAKFEMTDSTAAGQFVQLQETISDIDSSSQYRLDAHILIDDPDDQVSTRIAIGWRTSGGVPIDSDSITAVDLPNESHGRLRIIVSPPSTATTAVISIGLSSQGVSSSGTSWLYGIWFSKDSDCPIDAFKIGSPDVDALDYFRIRGSTTDNIGVDVIQKVDDIKVSRIPGGDLLAYAELTGNEAVTKESDDEILVEWYLSARASEDEIPSAVQEEVAAAGYVNQATTASEEVMSYLGKETISISSGTVSSLDSAIYNPDGNTHARRAIIFAHGSSIRYRMDGETITGSVGHLIATDRRLTLNSVDSIRNFRVTTTGVATSISVLYFR